MSAVALVMAILLPWLAGALTLRLLFVNQRLGGWAFCAGYGYLLGVFGSAAILAFFSIFGVRLSVFPGFVVFALIAALAFWRLSKRSTNARNETQDPKWQIYIFWVVLIWLGIRTTSLAFELFDRGLYSFDAFSTWMYRARVWVESGRLTPFVFPDVWLADRRPGILASPAAHYPSTVSLIAVWPSLAFGEWNERVALLPWLMLFVAIGLGLYGQSRAWGATRFEAILLVWLFLSLPLVGGQIALAGYADIWLCATLGFAFMSFLHWVRDQDRRHAFLALLFILAGISIKAEGLVWALFFIPSLLAIYLSARGWMALAAAASGVVLVLALFGGSAADLPLLGRVELSLDRVYTSKTGVFEFVAQDGVLRPLLIHFFIFDTWHLLILALAVGLFWQIGAVIDSRRLAVSWQRAALAWVLSAVAGFYVLFFWTPAAEWVRLGTSVNRILLQFALALVFWLQCACISRRHSTPNPQ